MFDPSDDFAAIADGSETVTLLRRGSASGTVVSHALRRAMTASEAAIGSRGDVRRRVAGGGQHIASDVVWHLPAAELTEAPRLGDWIIDGAHQRWTILEVKRTTLDSRWRCAARNVAVAFGLDDTISVLKAVYVKGACGAAEPIWRMWKAGVRARIQPIETKAVASTEARGAVTRCRIFVEEALDLDHTCCIRAADGTVYKFVSAVGAERIGELQVIDVEVI